MRKTALATLAAIAALAAIPTSPAIARKHAYCSTAGYTKAHIEGKVRCLHAGEVCSHKHASAYTPYRFRCVYSGIGTTYLLRKS
jgi:hypothetical protein